MLLILRRRGFGAEGQVVENLQLEMSQLFGVQGVILRNVRTFYPCHIPVKFLKRINARRIFILIQIHTPYSFRLIVQLALCTIMALAGDSAVQQYSVRSIFSRFFEEFDNIDKLRSCQIICVYLCGHSLSIL